LKLLKCIAILGIVFISAELFIRAADYFRMTNVEVLPLVSPHKLYKEGEDAFGASDEIRILLLGDSLLVGLGVRQEERFSRILERELKHLIPERRIHVIDGMVWGYNTYRKWQVFEQFMERDIKPTLIFYDYSLGDVYGGFPEITDEMREASRRQVPSAYNPALTALDRILGHSMLYRYLLPRVQLFLVKKGFLAGSPLMKDMLHEAYKPESLGWRATQGYLARMNQQSRGAGGLFVLHRAPDLLLFPDDPYRQAKQALHEFCRAEGIDLFESPEVLKGHVPSELTISSRDGHPSALTHQLLAKAVARKFSDLLQKEQVS